MNGSILFNEHDLLKEDISSKSKYLSTVFQNPKTQFYCINSSDELAFGLENRNITREEILSTIDKYTKLLKTEDLLNKDIFSLSGGEKQLLAITAVACLDNDIHLFDEPSASLDRNAIKRFKDVLRILKENDKIIIIAEHRLYYLKNLLDNLVVLENRNSYYFSKNDVLNNYEKIQNIHNLRRINEIMKDELNIDKIIKIKLLNNDEIQNKCDGDNILECIDFRSKFNEEILNFSINFKPGVYFIIGENGVGKSTFVKRLCNINKGKGKRFYNHKKINRTYNFISMVMQDVNYQIFTESCFDELNVIQENEELILSCLEEVGLKDKKDIHPQTLSGGEKQRLLIAKTKVSSKPIVILDEPTSGLDKLQMKRMSEYLNEFKEKGKTILVITHDYELIKECDETILEFIR